MEYSEYIPPSDKEIKEAQEKLEFNFSIEYIEFIKSGYNLGDSVLEALEINNSERHVNIYEAIDNARKYFNLPKEFLPIIEDNSDYYCLTKKGEVVFWSHNGTTNEKWSSINEWKAQMIKEANE